MHNIWWIVIVVVCVGAAVCIIGERKFFWHLSENFFWHIIKFMT